MTARQVAEAVEGLPNTGGNLRVRVLRRYSDRNGGKLPVIAGWWMFEKSMMRQGHLGI